MPIAPPRSLTQLQALTRQRLDTYPDSPFFGFAGREIDRIESRFLAGGPIDRAFYRSLDIGVMCARELESIDMPYCDAVYVALEDIRIMAGP